MSNGLFEEADYSITIDGLNVTRAFNPLLISLEIELTDGGETDRLIVTLDDSYGQIQLPRVGASVSAAIGWISGGAVTCFQGFTDEPKSAGSKEVEDGSIEQLVSGGDRGTGRTLTITAHSADMTSAVKQPMQAHADQMSFGQVAQQWGQKAGLSSVVVDQTLGAINRQYWAIANENFMAWGARTAKELGASFKIIGSTGIFVPRGGGTSASGQPLSGIRAVWGDNLVSWSIAPVLSRPNYEQFAVRNWDAVAAEWKQAMTSGGSSGSSITHTEQFSAPDTDQAQQKAGSNAAESVRDRGGADTVVIDGEPAAQPAASCTVSGVRSGVDGSYTIRTVRHRLSRSSGFTTECTFVQPGGGAGTDDRSAGASAN